MKRPWKRFVLRALAFCWLLAFLWGLPRTLPAASEPIRWLGHGEALEEARNTGKPVFLFFYTKPCRSCTRMLTKTLTDPAVKSALTERFLAVRVDTRAADLLQRKYGVRALPASYFLSSAGETIAYLPGALEPVRFLQVLDFIGQGHYRSTSLPAYLERRQGAHGVVDDPRGHRRGGEASGGDLNGTD